METQRRVTRRTLAVVWAIALTGLAAWFLLAWAGHALLAASGTWLVSFVDPWIPSAILEQRLETLLGWGENLGLVAVWSIWALGSIGVLLTAGFATLLLLHAQRATTAVR